MTGPEETTIQSTQRHSVPSVSSPVGQNNGMEANHQAATNTGPQISQPVPARLPTLHSWLARNLQMIPLVGGLLKVPPRHHSKFIVRGPKGPSVKTQKAAGGGKQLAAENAARATLMAVASCPGRKNPLRLLCFLPIIPVLTWK